MIVTAEGMSIRFTGSEVSPMGRTAKGVRAIQLKGDDRVVFGSQIEDDGHLVVVTDRVSGNVLPYRIIKFRVGEV